MIAEAQRYFTINLFSFLHNFLPLPSSDNFKKSFMKACMCTRGKDYNGQLQFENSIFPRFGRSARSSEKLSAIAKSNFHKTKTTIVCKESEAIANAVAIREHDKNGRNSLCMNATSTITIPNHIECKTHNVNGIKETFNEIPLKVQRSNEILHTDL